MDQQICRPGAMNMFVVIGVSFAQKKGETYKLIHKKGFATLKTRSTCTIQPRREKFNNPYNMPLEHYDWINIDELIKGLGEPEVVMMC